MPPKRPKPARKRKSPAKRKRKSPAKLKRGGGRARLHRQVTKRARTARPLGRRRKDAWEFVVPTVRRNSCERKYRDEAKKEFTPDKVLGKGVFGEVAQLCEKLDPSGSSRLFDRKKCPYVLKVQRLYLGAPEGTYFAHVEEPVFIPGVNRQEFEEVTIPTPLQFEREVRVQRAAYEFGKLAPRIYDAWTCADDKKDPHRGQGFIVMERLDGTLASVGIPDWTTAQRRQLIKDLKQLVRNLHQIGIEHGDLHGGNVLYRRHPDGHLEYVLTDFGLSRFTNEPWEKFVGQIHGAADTKQLKKLEYYIRLFDKPRLGVKEKKILEAVKQAWAQVKTTEDVLAQAAKSPDVLAAAVATRAGGGNVVPMDWAPL